MALEIRKQFHMSRQCPTMILQCFVPCGVDVVGKVFLVVLCGVDAELQYSVVVGKIPLLVAEKRSINRSGQCSEPKGKQVTNDSKLSSLEEGIIPKPIDKFSTWIY
ncbi:hypothetical protein DVH24_016695 [Malus domestica]|uniref:Uncharacterized protein n=1 Tax=Malus domestica TaxID=3750 RepID=A0A498HY80_MALDO|nr:hypothetical protein DVH24_016695 [Malus domestica]